MMVRRIMGLGLMMTVVVALFSATRTLGQPADPVEQTESITRAFDHFVTKGGAITWFILIPLSVVTVALSIEHFISIRRARLLPPPVIDHLRELIEKKDYAAAVEFTMNDGSMASAVVAGGLIEAPNGFSAMERGMEEAVEQRTSRLMRKIEYLNVIGNVAPMIGLFGTVYGMILAFSSIVEAGVPTPAKVAGGISIALVTTFWGLLIAIPALSVFAIFRNRIDVLSAECAILADQMLAVFKPGAGQPLKPAAAAGVRRSPGPAGDAAATVPVARPPVGGAAAPERA